MLDPELVGMLKDENQDLREDLAAARRKLQGWADKERLIGRVLAIAETLTPEQFPIFFPDLKPPLPRPLLELTLAVHEYKAHLNNLRSSRATGAPHAST